MRHPWLVAVLVLAAAFVGHAVVFQFTQDDAYISLRYAKNLVDGHGLVFNPGERVEGYSNFSWTLLLALCLKLGAPAIEASLWLGILFGIGAILAAARLAASLEGGWGPAAAATAALVAASSAFAFWSSGGLESAMFAFLVTWGLERGLAPDVDERGRAAAPLLLSAATLTRPEGPLFFLLWLASRVTDRAARRLVLRDVALFVVPLVPYAIWKLTYYGDLVPNTYYAKAGLSAAYLGRGLEYAWEYFRAYGAWGVAPAIALAAVAGAGGRGVEARLLFVWLGYAAYVVGIGGDVLYVHRFWLPTLPIGAVLVARGAAWIGKRLATSAAGVPPWGFTILATVALAGAGLAENWNDIHERRRTEELFVGRMRTLGEWLKREVPSGSTLATTTIGAISYHSELAVIDLLGLTDAEISRNPKLEEGLTDNWREVKYNAESVIRRRPDLILFSTGMRPSSASEKALYLYESFYETYYHYFFQADPTRRGSDVVLRLRGDAPPVRLGRVDARGVEFLESYAEGLLALGVEKDPARGIEMFLRSEKLASGTMPWAKQFRAATLWDFGDRETATPLLRQVVADDPYAVAAIERLARHALDGREFDRARRLYERIREIDRHYYVPWMGLADISRLEGDYAAGLEYAREGIGYWSTNPNSLVLYGQLALRVGRADDAKWAFQRALRIDPDSEHARVGLGFLEELRNLSPDELEAAR